MSNGILPEHQRNNLMHIGNRVHIKYGGRRALSRLMSAHMGWERERESLLRLDKDYSSAKVKASLKGRTAEIKVSGPLSWVDNPPHKKKQVVYC